MSMYSCTCMYYTHVHVYTCTYHLWRFRCGSRLDSGGNRVDAAAVVASTVSHSHFLFITYTHVHVYMYIASVLCRLSLSPSHTCVALFVVLYVCCSCNNLIGMVFGVIGAWFNYSRLHLYIRYQSSCLYMDALPLPCIVL